MSPPLRLYLLDDHTLFRQGLEGLLVAAGHEVVGSSDDPTQALSDIRQLEPDVALIDLHLAGRSGLDLLRDLSGRGLKARTLVLTMSSQPRHVQMALQLGARGYVLKGSPSDELLRAIRQVAAGQVFLGRGVDDLAQPNRQRAPGDDPFASLSMRELEVVRMVVDGHSSADIARELHLSPKTVDSYRSRLMAKVGAQDLTALVKLAVRHGLTDTDA